MPEISVLIPCLNEAKNLPQLADRLESMGLPADLEGLRLWAQGG